MSKSGVCHMCGQTHTWELPMVIWHTSDKNHHKYPWVVNSDMSPSTVATYCQLSQVELQRWCMLGFPHFADAWRFFYWVFSCEISETDASITNLGSMFCIYGGFGWTMMDINCVPKTWDDHGLSQENWESPQLSFATTDDPWPQPAARSGGGPDQRPDPACRGFHQGGQRQHVFSARCAEASPISGNLQMDTTKICISWPFLKAPDSANKTWVSLSRVENAKGPMFYHYGS